MTHIETDNPIIKLWVEYYELIWEYKTLVLVLLAIIAIVHFRRYVRLRKETKELKRMQDEKVKRLRQVLERQKNIQEAIFEDDTIEIEDIRPVRPFEHHCKGPSG